MSNFAIAIKHKLHIKGRIWTSAKYTIYDWWPDRVRRL